MKKSLITKDYHNNIAIKFNKNAVVCTKNSTTLEIKLTYTRNNIKIGDL